MNNEEKTLPFMSAILILLSLAAIGLNLHSQAAKYADLEAITMSRTKCINACSTYEVTISSSGLVDFQMTGIDSPSIHKTAQISGSEFKRLKFAVDEINFNSLTTNFSEPGKHNIDGQCGNKSDGNEKLTVVTKTPMGNTIVNHSVNCSTLPIHNQFFMLGDLIDKIAGTSTFIIENKG